MLLKDATAAAPPAATTTTTTATVRAGAGGDYRVEVARQITAVDPISWNEVVLAAGGDVFHSHEWLAAFETAPPGRFEAAHLLAYTGDQLVGVCPAYLTHHCPRLRYTLSRGAPRALQVTGPLLLAHSLAGLSGGPLAVPGHPAAVHALADGLELLGAELGAWAVGYANLPAGPFTGRLLGAGYATAQVATRYLIRNRWQSAEQYWASLSRHRRTRLRHERRKSERSGYLLSQDQPDDEDLIRLVHGLLRARGTPTELLPAPLLCAMNDQLARHERSVVAREGSAIRALVSGYQFGGRWTLWLAGLDTERLTVFEPYHALLAYVVEAAIRDAIPVVDLGRANGAVKRRYGAHPEPLLLAIKSGDRGRDALLHLWCRELEQSHHAVLNGLETTSRCC
ncbi:MAG: GNAT family N-acetyltransferase [Pseudonocardiaceae bacterium]